MKITLQETPVNGDARRVEIEVPGNHLAMSAVVEDLLRPALLAWGFVEATVEEFFGQE